MSQVSCGKFSLAAETIDLFVDSVEGSVEWGRRCSDKGQACPKDSGVSSGAEQRDPDSFSGNSVAMTLRYTCDQAAEAKPPEVVADLALRELSRIEAQQWRQESAKIFCLKTLRLNAEQHKDGEECLDARIVNAKGRNPLITHAGRQGELLDDLVADHAVMTDLLDVQYTSVGVEADRAKKHEIGQHSSDAYVAGVVDGGFGAKGSSFFVVLLHVRVLVVEVQRGNDSIGNHARAERGQVYFR